MECDFYLAKHWKTTVYGAECDPYMTDYANRLFAQERESLLGEVKFFTLKQPTSLSELPDNMFDLVFIKEVLYNVPNADKEGYIQEMIRVLKPGGTLIIVDWIHNPETSLEHLKQAILSEDFCHFFDLKQYERVLNNLGLVKIQSIDRSAFHINFASNVLERIQQSHHQILDELGEDTFRNSMKSATFWRAAIEHGELLSCTFSGIKP